MAIKQIESGWLVDSQPAGRGGKRFRKSFKTKAEAKTYEAWLKTQVNQDAKWQPEKRDLRRLTELIEIWFTHHGSGLRSGEDARRRMIAAAEAMGNPVADRFTVNMFADYRTKRLAQGITANNLNREHAYLRSVFNELARLGQWTRPNPLAKLRQFKIQETELTYLTTEQIESLLEALQGARNPHVLLIAKVCLATGARWGEAQELRRSQIHSGLIQFAKTKSGKVRAVPVADELIAELLHHYKKHGTGERLFEFAETAFREGVGRAGLELPNGQMTHSLRHTFASHFMMNGGNILTLQRILGHASLTMTMRYAHLAPDHLQEAKRLNPLANLGDGTATQQQ